ncbi:membrane-spanning 4-domains subfamily A member 3-like isoform X2 [Eleutherodactylus coqui]|uniref:membrane-spanning 4-domains subfamily A member 3-like isoform X2 n=1 Tax=Eleutherodactylus coqui TaxID=57060 RepID=UPI003463050E
MALLYGDDDFPPQYVVSDMSCSPWYRFSDAPFDRQTMEFYQMFLRGKPKWIGFIATGSLTFYAGASRSSQYIKLAFAMNVSNVFLSCVGTALNSLDVNTRYPSYSGRGTTVVTVCFLILTNLLQFILTIPVLVSGCRSIRCYEAAALQVYVIPNNASSLLPPPYSAEPAICIEAPPSYSDSRN